MVQLKILEPFILYLKSTSASLYHYWYETNVEFRIQILVKSYPIIGKLVFLEDEGQNQYQILSLNGSIWKQYHIFSVQCVGVV